MAKEEYQQELESLKSDMTQLRTDLGELMERFREMGHERVDETRSRARSEVERRRDQLNQAYEKARQEGREYYDAAHHRLEEHPLTSIGLAFGLGMLLGKVLSR
ncbi:MAG: hypothetical protein K9K64_17290 [Desulfohalobiaceae bacterium]|nr:hypothetical protein [Desulfohalobiaceae bacterium]